MHDVPSKNNPLGHDVQVVIKVVQAEHPTQATHNLEALLDKYPDIQVELHTPFSKKDPSLHD